jgi:ankyrin repeat protein/uncharacterized glyoxalase superfamily protein PhnB
VDNSATPTVEAFFAACTAGDLSALRELLSGRPGLVHERYEGTTGLHVAVHHPEAIRLLLEHGADPHARDVGDNALALHFAAGGGPLESVRALLDAGSDVHGTGDLHQTEVIGWATLFGEARRDVVDLLVERGARHHVFSAIALGDLELIRQIAANDPAAMKRRLSRFEQEQTALHYVVAPADGLVGGLFRKGNHYLTLELLIELGADLEAEDARGRTPLAVAMLRGDAEAMRRLHAAGASLPAMSNEPITGPISSLAPATEHVTPMLSVPDVDATVAWYQSIGFELVGSYGDSGKTNWASVRFGAASLMFVPAGGRRQPVSGLSVWMNTSKLDDLYAYLKRLQLDRARAMLTGNSTTGPEVRFAVDLYTAFYGQREFGIVDPNGVHLMFAQPVKRGES